MQMHLMNLTVYIYISDVGVTLAKSANNLIVLFDAEKKLTICKI